MHYIDQGAFDQVNKFTIPLHWSFVSMIFVGNAPHVSCGEVLWLKESILERGLDEGTAAIGNA